ncbi:hypothetical protein P9139_17980 [Curtobacterium flaccumfaciens]|nr:hypothetical protein P9139_17980 [Curtobacterium flaccumfaciens]
MTNTSLPQSPSASAAILEQYGTELLEVPMRQVNPGFYAPKPTIGDRYVAVLRQEPNNDRQPDRLTLDRINPERPDHLGVHPETGYQWGWDDKDGPEEFVFTVVGTYILDGITPLLPELTFTATFHREPQEVTA